MSISSKKDEFTDIYRDFSDSIFRFCYFRTSDREQALDLVQESFVRLWNELALGKAIENPRAFLFAVARNLIIDYYRKAKTLSLDALAENDENSYRLPKDMNAFVNAEARYLIEKIQDLDPPFRQVIYLRYVEEMMPKEIAEITGESVNAVSIRITRGMEKLRKLVGEQ